MAAPVPLVAFLAALASPLALAGAPAEVGVEAVPLLQEVEQLRTSPQSVMFRLRVPEATGEVQQDQDLVVVLDVSGSMSGDGKLEKAKAAAAALINNLRDNDRLHLVTYHSRAKVEFTRGTASEREQLLEAVAALQPQEMTNLFAGLEKAESILRAESDRRSTKRIFLFSDGLVNRGITDHDTILAKVEQLRQRGTPTSAFGIGADYDHVLMSAIAEAGHGEFFFIQGGQDMEKVVHVAAAGFRGLFATEAELRLTPLGGAELLIAYGHELRATPDNSSWSLRLGDLRGGEQRSLLVDLSLPGVAGSSVEFLSYELTYGVAGRSDVNMVHRGRVLVRAIEQGTQPSAPDRAVEYFRRLQRLLLREEEVEQRIHSGDLGGAASLEEELEEDLGALASRCAEQLKEEPVCMRASAAHHRTRQSRSFFSGELGAKVASNAYKFKRQMNSQMKETYDEL